MMLTLKINMLLDIKTILQFLEATKYLFLEIKEIPGFVEVEVFKNLFSYVCLKIACYSINKHFLKRG